MTDPDRAFLTDARRDILAGKSDWEDSSIAVEKSRIKNRANVALEELIEVADSRHLDHTDALDPDDVFNLLRALLSPPLEHTEHDEIQGGPNTGTETSDKFDAYSDRLQMQLAKLALGGSMGMDMSDWTDEHAPNWNEY